jgi:hypothetical protein
MIIHLKIFIYKYVRINRDSNWLISVINFLHIFKLTHTLRHTQYFSLEK